MVPLAGTGLRVVNLTRIAGGKCASERELRTRTADSESAAPRGSPGTQTPRNRMVIRMVTIAIRVC